MQWHQLEVDSLNEWPDHPVLLQGSPVCAFQLGLRTRTLHDRHAAEENEEVGAGEEQLVAADASGDLEVLVLEDHLVLQELEPGGCGRAEDCCDLC